MESNLDFLFAGFAIFWASIVTVMTFLFGFLFILIGILGAYLSRIHRALQAPPRFIISETSHKEPGGCSLAWVPMP